MNLSVCALVCVDADTNPQTLLFSATCPPWVYDVAKKYMRPSCKHVDLIGKKTQKAATTVEVGVCVREREREAGEWLSLQVCPSTWHVVRNTMCN